MPEPVSVLPHRTACPLGAADVSVSALPPDRLRNTVGTLASHPDVRGSAALQTFLRLGFWSILPNWFCDQSHQLIECANASGDVACAIALARHLVLRRTALQSIEEQVACLHELHELHYAATVQGAAQPIAPSVSTYENACIAVCLRFLSQTYDPFRWRHRAPASLGAQEKAFDAAVFRFCQATPVPRVASPDSLPDNRPASTLRRGVGLAPARILILAALQQYFGGPFEPQPINQRASLTATLAAGLPLVVIGSTGPIDGDDTRHAWVCEAWQEKDGCADILDPASASIGRQPLGRFLDRLSADSVGFAWMPA